MSISRLDCCRLLSSSQTNCTMTHFASHGKGFSHDCVNRLLRRDKLTGKIIWEHVKGDVVQTPNGCLVFDDSVLDKNHSKNIEPVERQHSGNAHDPIRSIAVVDCLHINPDNGNNWVVDYGIFNPDGDGKSKLDHAGEMLPGVVCNKNIAFDRVLFDG